MLCLSFPVTWSPLPHSWKEGGGVSFSYAGSAGEKGMCVCLCLCVHERERLIQVNSDQFLNRYLILQAIFMNNIFISL